MSCAGHAHSLAKPDKRTKANWSTPRRNISGTRQYREKGTKWKLVAARNGPSEGHRIMPKNPIWLADG